MNGDINGQHTGGRVESGIDAAKRLLIEIRLLAQSARKDKLGPCPASVAALIEDAVPANALARAGFYMALGEYLTTALEGATMDVERLGSSPYITLAYQAFSG